jgi:hypothetical protein
MLRFFVSLTPVKKTVLALLFLSAIAVGLFWPLLAADKILFFGDISLYFTPLLHFQREEVIGHGRIPLWNPEILCGTPFIGNPQAWPLYPSSVLLYWLSAERSTGIIGAFHVLWAAIGTFPFLRLMGRSRAASLLAAVAWGFGGVLVSKMQFPNMVQAASWLPWLLLACEGVLRRPTAARSVLVALVIGLALLAAHPQMFVLQLYLALAWTLWRLAGRKEGRRQRLAFLCLGFVLGVGLAAAQILPTLELVGHSVRPDLPLEKANRFILPPYAVLTNFVLPNFYGNPALANDPYVGRGNFWEPCCYLGLLPFGFFVYGAAARFQDRDTRFWLAAALLGVWLAVGRDAWLFGIAFHVLPGINRFHDAARFLVPACFAMACVSASGFDHFFEKLKRRQQIGGGLIILLLTVIDVIVFSRTLNPTIDVEEFRAAVAASGRKVPMEGRLFQTDEGKIWGAFISYRTYETLATREDRAAFLRSLAPNLPVLGDWRDASGYEPVRLASMDSLLGTVKDAARNHTLNSRQSLLDALAVERLAYWNRGLMRTQVVARPRGPRTGRAILWLNGKTVDSASQVFSIVNSPRWDGQPVSESGLNSGMRSGAGRAVPLPLTVRDISPNQVDVVLPLPHALGLVVVADSAYPGWFVTVNGEAAESLRLNGALRGVLVSKNASLVRWTYAPTTWRLGVFLSLVTVGIMALMAAPTAAAW